MLWYGPLPYVNIVSIHSNPIPRLNQSKTNESEEIGYLLNGVFFSDFSNLQKNISKNYPELEI